MHKLGDLQTVTEMNDQDVVTAISETVDTENALAAYKYALLAQFSRRGLNIGLSHSTPAHWLATGTRIPAGNATRQFARADWLTLHPAILDALATGSIHDAHVKDIYDGYHHITAADPTLTPHQLAQALTELLTVAQNNGAHDVKTRAQELAHTYTEQSRERARREAERREQQRRGPTPPQHNSNTNDDDSGDDDDLLDGPPPQPVSENPALNTLEMYLQSNGRTHFRGDLDKHSAERLRAAIAEHSRPTPGPDGTRDDRTPRRRNADALITALDHRRRSGPDTATAPARVNVTVHLNDLIHGGRPSEIEEHQRDWPFHLDWTGPISHSLARMLTCDADMRPIILDDNGIPMAMGTTIRLATAEQRAVVTIRDRCCIKCGKAARYCHVHHIEHWADGGPTDLTNLTLLCTDCHNDVHHRGWNITIGHDGHPTVIPPTTIDPARTPIPSYHRRRKPAA